MNLDKATSPYFLTLLKTLSEDKAYELEERAAILQYEAGYKKMKAEYQAIREYKKQKVQ